IEAAIIDPLAADKFESGVYSFLSIGIKGARVDTSKKALETAPEGWIRGGKIVEVSGVDVGSNQNAKAAPLELVKTVGDMTYRTAVLGGVEEADSPTVEVVEPDISTVEVDKVEPVTEPVEEVKAPLADLA